MRSSLTIIFFILTGTAWTHAQEPGSRVQARSPQQAMQEDMCSHYSPIRTSRIDLDNETPFLVDIWFVQALDTKGNAPNSDFVLDTGVIVGATYGTGLGAAAPGQGSIDPCRAGSNEHPIQADVCEGSVKLLTDQGEIDVQLEPDKSDPAPYFNECGWRLTVDDNGHVSTHLTKHRKVANDSGSPKNVLRMQ
jgi:hypothetical protein